MTLNLLVIGLIVLDIYHQAIKPGRKYRWLASYLKRQSETSSNKMAIAAQQAYEAEVKEQQRIYNLTIEGLENGQTNKERIAVERSH